MVFFPGLAVARDQRKCSPLIGLKGFVVPATAAEIIEILVGGDNADSAICCERSRAQ